MRSFIVEPAVPGDNSSSPGDWSVHPPIIQKLNFEFDFLLNDVLFEAFPNWIVTIPAKEAIQSAGLSGASFDKVKISKSPDFKELEPSQKLPKFAWLKVNGDAGRDDFGVTRDLGPVLN
jgi:hypothetical protein